MKNGEREAYVGLIPRQGKGVKGEQQGESRRRVKHDGRVRE